MNAWENIKNKVEQNDSVATFTMTELRDATGKEKLGVHVKAEISKTLTGLGIGHIPRDLPSYQDEVVRLYKRGTPIGDFLEIVITPGEQHDRRIRDQLSQAEFRYIEIIEKIRELVTE